MRQAPKPSVGNQLTVRHQIGFCRISPMGPFRLHSAPASPDHWKLTTVFEIRHCLRFKNAGENCGCFTYPFNLALEFWGIAVISLNVNKDVWMASSSKLWEAASSHMVFVEATDADCG